MCAVTVKILNRLTNKLLTDKLVKDSIVEHLGSRTLGRLSTHQQNDLKWRNVHIFNEKYGRNKFANNIYYKQWTRTNT